MDLGQLLLFLIIQNGFLSAFPHVLTYLFSFVVGISADKLLNMKVLSVVQIRKLYNSISQYGGAIGCIILAFAGCNRAMAIAAMSLSVGINAAAYAGYFVSHYTTQQT